MKARVMRPALTFTTVVAVLAAALAVYAFLSAGATHADSVFGPTYAVRMCNALPAGFSTTDPSLAGTGPTCAETLTAGTATDFTTITNFPDTNLNFSNVVTMSPNAPTAVGAAAKIGGLRSLTNLGLINNPCTTALTVDFILYNTTLPNAATRAAMTNIAWPQPEGTTNRHLKWRVDDGTHTSSPPAPADPEWADPSDADVTSTDGFTADGTSVPFANYPSHLLDIFDPDFVVGVGDGAVEPKIPLAAYGGMTLVSGTWVPLYFLVFPDTGVNSLSGGTPMPAPLGDINGNMGFPSVSVLTDPSAAIASPSTITDFCVGNTDLNITAMLRSTVHSNPAAGTRFFEQYAASQRDTDQDGFENQIDTCPFNAAPAEDPSNAVGVNDADSDGIMNSCDTNTPAASGADVDTDGFQNRQDNCPQVANTLQTEDEAGVAPADKGPRVDGVGNACDSEATSLTITQNGLSTTITLSDAVGNGRYMSRTNAVPKCFSGTDADGDGYCTAGGTTNDTAATDGGAGAACLTPTNSCFVRHSLWLGATHPGLQQDTDGDTVTPDAGPVSNWSDAIESYLGTDPTKPCAASGTANNEGPLDNWPLDMDDNRLVNGGDYLKYNTVLGSAAGGNRGVNVGGNGDGTLTTPATIAVPGMGTQVQTRFDLNHDGFLSGADQGKFNSYINDGACSDTTPTVGTPPLTPGAGGVFQQ